MSAYTHTFWNLSLEDLDQIREECGEMVKNFSLSAGWIEVEFSSEEEYHQYVTR